MEKGDIAQTCSREIGRNLTAGASIVAVGLEYAVKRLEPVVLLMLLSREGKATTWNRLLQERLKRNEHYQRRLQYA